jgi:hypothetical protein
METVTFKDKNNEYEFTVKKEFLQNCPNPETFAAFELFDNHAIYHHFHNTEGPAFTELATNRHEFFINGKYVKEGEERDKIIFGKKFKDGFDSELKK